ncbi:MAG: enoyl-CoA hydratase-related protein [Betaproteobacteria bacterium]
MEAKSYHFVLLERKAGIATLTLNRPKERNALNQEMREELLDALNQISADPEIRAVLLCGAGDTFCAGGDLANLANSPPGAGFKRLETGHQVIRLIREMKKVAVAALQGHVVGAGLGLALACDFVVAAENCKFSAGFLKLGLVPDWGVSHTLPRLVGLTKAKDILLRSRTLDANEALQIGLIHSMAQTGSLFDQALKLALDFAQGPQAAMALCKSMLNQSPDLRLEELLAIERLAQDMCLQTEEHREGLAAFREKRAPNFVHPDSRNDKSN